MSSYFIESFKIDKLWGNQNIDIPFNKDVNVLIGPNGSGKTTVLTLLHSILSGDLRSVVNFNFQQAKIGLKSFKGNSVRTVKVDIGEEFLKLKVGKKEYEAPIDIFFRRRPVRSLLRDFYERDNVITNLLSEDIDSESTPIVPLIWLPVSRRLPLTENDEERHIRTERSESVDLRLKELLDRLSRYYLILNAQFSERRREFEGQALSTMLYSKEHDQLDSMLNSISSFPLPTKPEKTQLLNAFKATGFLDEKMQTQIDDYFTKAERVLKRISEGKNISIEDIPILPIIRRTQTMVKSARRLEKHRKTLFSPLRLYEDIVNSFLEDKTIAVDESDGLKIESSSKLQLNWRDLSSGEKQILILLTEVLLKVDEPVVYIADEPELSLHVTWQEKLLESIVTLGRQKQIIVATHSPDIVGKFRDNVITLGKGS